MLKILVATHKSYPFPKESCYFPIHVGKAMSLMELNILSDNLGDNISSKNFSFCELTALYWAWKNHFFSDATYVGLIHYRRYFKGSGEVLKQAQITSEKDILKALSVVDCIVAKRRNYYIETVYSHYKNAHFIDDLKQTRKILSEKYPEYLDSFDMIMQGKTLHLYNMFIMSTAKADKYCDWLFDILLTLENRIDISQYDNYQQRVFGFIGERLLNVWLLYNQISIKEIEVVNLEKEKWLFKGFNFLKRKIIGKFNSR